MKKILIIVGITVLVMVGILLISKFRKGGNEEATEEIPTPTIVLPTISGNVNVSLIPKNENKAVALKITGLSIDITSIEYELTYITGGGLPRGVLGKITIKEGETEVSRDDIVLGTCSSGKCVYDIGVTSVDLSLKFNTAEGPRIFQKTYSL